MASRRRGTREQDEQEKSLREHQEARRAVARAEGPPDRMPGRCYVCRAPWWQRPLNWKVQHPQWTVACWLCDRCHEATVRLKDMSEGTATKVADERQCELPGMPRVTREDA